MVKICKVETNIRIARDQGSVGIGVDIGPAPDDNPCKGCGLDEPTVSLEGASVSYFPDDTNHDWYCENCAEKLFGVERVKVRSIQV